MNCYKIKPRTNLQNYASQKDVASPQSNKIRIKGSFCTFVLDLWLGSSLECKSPAPKDGNWVWKTEIRPPVGDISLKAAWRAGPNALCVSLVWVNMFGSAFNRSFISCRTDWKGFMRFGKHEVFAISEKLYCCNWSDEQTVLNISA